MKSLLYYERPIRSRTLLSSVMSVECQQDIQNIGQGISELRNVSTTKHPAYVMMFGVVPLNGEKMPPVWFPRCYRLTAAAYKDVLVAKILPWVRKIIRNANYVFQLYRHCSQYASICCSRRGSGQANVAVCAGAPPTHTVKNVQEWLGSNMNFWPKDF